MRRALLLLPLALVALATSPAAAQPSPRSLDLERFRPAADRHGFLGIPGTRTPGEWAWNTALFTGYQLQPLSVQRVDTDERTAIVAHRATAELLAQLGITDRAAVVVHLPFVAYQDASAGPLGGPAIPALAIRDPYVAARVRLFGPGVEPDHARHEGEGLAAQLGITLPFGHEEAFAGEGAPSLDATVMADFHFLDFAVGAFVGYRHRFAEPVLLGVRFANELSFGVALKSPTIVIPNLSAILEIRVATALDQVAFQDASTAFEGELGARWAEGDVALTWAIGMGFNGGVGVPGVRGVFGIDFAPRTHDADGDGLTDERDGCARLPEDFDGHEDEDGCPDPDNDGDLVPDEDDRCPTEASDFEHDADEDGCTDPIVDGDGDGVPDGDDGCPTRPEDRDGHDDEDGCPEEETEERSSFESREGTGIESGSQTGPETQPETAPENQSEPGTEPRTERDAPSEALPPASPSTPEAP